MTNGNCFNFGFSLVKSWAFDVGQEGSFDASCLLLREVKQKEAEFLSIFLFKFLLSFGTTFEQFEVD